MFSVLESLIRFALSVGKDGVFLRAGELELLWETDCLPIVFSALGGGSLALIGIWAWATYRKTV